MRIVSFLGLALLALGLSLMDQAPRPAPIGATGRGPFEPRYAQKTCALYVAVRSAAFGAPLAFGREVEDSMVHWNKCPGGKMVACEVRPTADGDSVVTGIPWPH